MRERYGYTENKRHITSKVTMQRQGCWVHPWEIRAYFECAVLFIYLWWDPVMISTEPTPPQIIEYTPLVTCSSCEYDGVFWSEYIRNNVAPFWFGFDDTFSMYHQDPLMLKKQYSRLHVNSEMTSAKFVTPPRIWLFRTGILTLSALTFFLPLC